MFEWDQRPRPFVVPVPTVRWGGDVGVLSRAQGCLLGQLAGDSLGGLVEFRTAAAIEQTFPNGVRDLVDGGHWRNLAGQATDDSEMALMLARTLARDKRWTPATALAGYVHWYRSGPFDIGATTSTALSAAASAADPAAALAAVEARANPLSQANGSLMRISPLGIFAAGRPALAGELARADSGLTHPHPVCRDSCAVFAAAIAHGIAAGDGPSGAFRAALSEAARISAVEPVRRVLAESADTPPREYHAQMGWVLIALGNAFWQLLHARWAEDGIIDTVGRGGDTDTNGAIAGALLGAVHGREAIPARWVSVLGACRPTYESGAVHPRPPEFWPVDALDLAESVLVAGAGYAPAGRISPEW